MIDEFLKVELRVAKVLSAERVEGSDKLVKLQVSLGDSDPSTNSGSRERQIIAGIGKAYEPEKLVGREIVVVTNLDPRVFNIKGHDPSTLRSDSGQAGSSRPGSGQAGQVGLESQGMLLAAQDADGRPVILTPEREVPAGSSIR